MNKIIEQLKNWFNGLFTGKEEKLEEVGVVKEETEEPQEEPKEIVFPTAEEATRITYNISEEERREYIKGQIMIGISNKTFSVHLRPAYVTEAILEELRQKGYTITPPERNRFGEYFLQWPEILKE